uniref:Photosystem I assembly protein Ycf4 n=1 Tax=Passiflora rhamnifolia TaxID=343974 RepID=A0A7H0TZ82_9ROSI|nr:Ycf4 [Passiflora rhamnifolia]QNR06334.1 Ycf4 [Passiflora rhamnifolia]
MRNSEPPFNKSTRIDVFPHVIVMFLYGIASLFASFYLQCTSWRNGGSGVSDYDQFNQKPGVVCIFRWGYPGPDPRILILFLIKDIEAIRIHYQEGIDQHFMLFLEVRGKGSISLFRSTDYEIIEEKAYDLADFLDVPINLSWFRPNK